MSKGSFVSLPVIIFFVLGIIGIALLVPIVIDVYNRMVHGKCWADMQETISGIKSDLNSIHLSGGEASKSVFRRITVGECVGAVIIFNKASQGSYQSYPPNLARFEWLINQECPMPEKYPYGSYALVLPWKTVKEEIQTNEPLWYKIGKTLSWKTYQDWYKEAQQTVRFLKPTCSGIEGSIGGSSYVYFLPPEMANPDTPMNEKDVSQCYEIVKYPSGTSGYSYELKPAADSKCPDTIQYTP